MIAAPTAIVELINKNNPNYQHLDSYIKNNYWCLPNNNGPTDKDGNAETFIKIPRTREYGLILGTTMTWLSEYLQGKPPKLQEMLETINNVLPTDITNPQTVLQPVGTFIQGATGNEDVRNWNGARIIPKSEAGNVFPKDQYDATTSGFAKYLGEKLNISPRLLDYLIDSYAGGYSKGIKGITADTRNPRSNFINSMFTNKFTADSVYSNDLNDQFYGALDAAKRQAGSDKKNNSANYDKSKETYSTLSKYSKDISELYTQAKEAENKGNMNKARQLRQQIAQLEQEALNSIK